MAGLKVVFGGGGYNPGRAFGEPGAVEESIKIMKEYGCNTIDTAALYGKSEELLGNARAGDQVTIDTKTRGGFGGKGHASKETILSEAQNSREMLKCDVDIYYIHAPDADAPLEDTLAGINEVYKKGFFKRFGLSNYRAEDVEKVYNHCKEKGYPLPSVYQGNYSPVARRQEEVLFPTLKKLGIAFYAYSPIAGGFLTKTKQDILDGKGRFDPSTPLGGLYANLYAKPSYLEALGQWEAIAKEEGVTKAELAYRWVTFNSPLKREQGDAIIIGASSFEQLKQTLASVNKGPLSEKAVKGIDDLWKTIEKDAPLDNYNQ